MHDESLASYLNTIQASPDVVQQALRYYLSERTADLPPEDMRESLYAESIDKARTEQQLAALENSSHDVEDAALLYLSEAWADENQHDGIRSALDAANKSLPVVETIALATVTLYAMYLMATGGKKREIRRVHRKRDGSFVEEIETTFVDPSPWLKSVTSLFRGLGRDP